MNVHARGDGTTVIAGSLIDQAALRGVLQRIRDLGLQVISVERLDPGARLPLPTDLE